MTLVLVTGMAATLKSFRMWVADRDGVFSRRDAFEHGVTDKLLYRGIDRGEWTRYEGVYLLGGKRESDRTRLRAALMHAGSHAMVTATSALGVYGLDIQQQGFNPLGGGVPHLWIPANRHGVRSDAVYLRDRIAEANPRYRQHFRLVSPQRAVIDAMRVLELDEAKEITYRAIQQCWITPAEISRWIAHLSGSRGMPQLRQMQKIAVRNVHSAAEDVLHEILAKAEITGWTANSPVHDHLGLVGIVDVLFDEFKLAIEVDGYQFHSSPQQHDRDSRRQNRLINAGYRVLRFTWQQLQNPHQVIAEIKKELQRAVILTPTR